jgi:uncharacterized protein YciI
LPYAIQTVDKPNSGALRAKVRDEHLKYLDANMHRLLAAGAVISDDGTGGHGGILIVDTDVRREAEEFIAGDPFSKAGLFEKVTVTRWRKAYFNKQKFV